MLPGPAQHALRVLEIAPRFIEFKHPNIFVLTANASAYVLLEILKDETHWRSANPIESIKAAIASHNSQTDSYQAKKQDLLTLIEKRQETTSTPEATRAAIKELRSQIDAIEPRTLQIGDYEWAVACKLVMQQSKILSDSSKMKEATKSLIEQIQTIQAVTSSDIFKKGAAFLRIDGQYFQELFLNFMGKLCVANELVSARVIHQYFRLAQSALALRDINELDSTKIGMTLAPGLFESLDIFGHILPRTGDEALDVSADAKEYACFKIIMKELVLIDVFSKDFSPALYLPFLKPEDLPKAVAAAPAAASSSSPASMMQRLRELRLDEADTFKRDKKDTLAQRERSHSVLPGYSLLSAVTKGSPPSGSRSDSPSDPSPSLKKA
ncbi:MAG: hypothetical protein AB7I18_09785 [Candidatus Berkiella sp.]